MLITHIIRTDLPLHLKCYSGDRCFPYWLLNSAGQEIQDAMWCTSMSSELLSGPSSAAEGSFLGRVQQYWTVHMEIKVQVGMSLCPIESLVGPSTACNITPHLHVHHAPCTCGAEPCLSPWAQGQWPVLWAFQKRGLVLESRSGAGHNFQALF